MKKMLIGALLFAAAAAPAVAQTHVSINIGDPGFFGLIDNRGYGAPRVYLERPVIVRRVNYYQEPVYLRVPTRHRENWGRYCYRYEACGLPVLFVRESWYNNTYAPRVRHLYGDDYRDVARHEYRHSYRPRHDEPHVVYRDRPAQVVEKVVYRDRPHPVVVEKIVYRDSHRDRDDRHHGKSRGHDKHHGKHHDKHHDKDDDRD